MNVVISTTVQWNIGDQFILNGVLRLLRLSWGDIHVILHDRNPDRLPLGGSAAHSVMESGWADAFVVAGSPGWTGECSAIYETALRCNVPIFLIGIGSGSHAEGLSSQIERDVFVQDAIEKASLIICRDEPLRDLLKERRQDIHLLPCPASMIERRSSPYRASTVGAMGPWWVQQDCDICCAHQTSDIQNHDAFFSSDTESYYDLYASAKRVISSRLHASIVCRVMGTPVENLWPEDDCRCPAAWSLVSETCLDDAFNDYCKLISSTS